VNQAAKRVAVGKKVRATFNGIVFRRTKVAKV